MTVTTLHPTAQKLRDLAAHDTDGALRMLVTSIEGVASAFSRLGEALEHLTCDEADCLAKFLFVTGHPDDAIDVLLDHAQGDYDETTAHHAMDVDCGAVTTGQIEQARRDAKHLAHTYLTTLVDLVA